MSSTRWPQSASAQSPSFVELEHEAVATAAPGQLFGVGLIILWRVVMQSALDQRGAFVEGSETGAEKMLRVALVDLLCGSPCDLCVSVVSVFLVISPQRHRGFTEVHREIG